MSEQVEFLKNCIATARTGNEGAVTLLRQICVVAAEKAPNADLITMSECLFRIGIEATRSQISRN
jgi:hypothetical protein